MSNGEKSLRQQQVDERRKRIAELTPRTERVRVVPANDAMRKALKHPSSGMAFPESGSAEWPLDRFTKRRIADGSVKREEAEQDQRGHRARAHTREAS